MRASRRPPARGPDPFAPGVPAAWLAVDPGPGPGDRHEGAPWRPDSRPSSWRRPGSRCRYGLGDRRRPFRALRSGPRPDVILGRASRDPWAGDTDRQSVCQALEIQSPRLRPPPGVRPSPRSPPAAGGAGARCPAPPRPALPRSEAGRRRGGSRPLSLRSPESASSFGVRVRTGHFALHDLAPGRKSPSGGPRAHLGPGTRIGGPRSGP